MKTKVQLVFLGKKGLLVDRENCKKISKEMINKFCHMSRK